MIIANFTPDSILWMHGGQDGTLKPGDIMDCPDNRGRHILNKFDRRGILQLMFGDDPDERRKDAMKLWKLFWERQVTIFNQDNERRKNTNKEYLDPTQELSEHAEKLGLALVGPWSIKRTDDEQMRKVLDENNDLRTQMSQLMAQVAALTKAVQDRDLPKELRTTAENIELAKKRGVESQEKETPASPDAAKLISEFNRLSSEKFGEWVMTNLDRLQSDEFPPAVRKMVQEKWERLIGGEFPLPQ